MISNKVIHESDDTSSFNYKFHLLVEKYKRDCFPHLKHVKIVFSFVDPPRWKDKTQMIEVKSTKFSPMYRDLNGYDFHVEICKDVWSQSDRNKKARLLWRGMRPLHVHMDESNNVKLDAFGRVMISIDKPDIEVNFFHDEFIKFGTNGTLKSVTEQLKTLVSQCEEDSSAEK